MNQTSLLNVMTPGRAEIETNKFVGTHWKQLLLLVVCFFVLNILFALLAVLIAGSILFSISSGTLKVGTYLFPVLGGVIVFWILLVQVFGVWWFISLIEYVTKNYRGQQINFWSAIKNSWKILAKSFGTAMVSTLCNGVVLMLMIAVAALLWTMVSFAVTVSNTGGQSGTIATHLLTSVLNSGFLLLPFIGVWIFSLYLQFTMHAAVTPGKYYLKAILYSMSLVKGKWWKVFGYQLWFMAQVIAVTIIAGILTAVTGEDSAIAKAISLLNQLIIFFLLVRFTICLSILFLHFSGQAEDIDVTDTNVEEKTSSHFVRISVVCLILIALASAGSYAAAGALQPIFTNFSMLLNRPALNVTTSGSVLNGSFTNGSMQDDGCIETVDGECGVNVSNGLMDLRQIQVNQNQEYHPNRIYHDKE